MSLKEKLKAQKEKFLTKAPPEAAETMARATAELRDSGITERALNVGQTMPSFELENQAGQKLSSQELLSQGPLVLSFYRGKW